MCTKVKGEPVYEAVRPISAHMELVVYYLPERPEELFFVRMRNNLYRQTMDSILEGNNSTIQLLLINNYISFYFYLLFSGTLTLKALFYLVN